MRLIQPLSSLLGLVIFTAAGNGMAANLVATITNQEGESVDDAVLYIESIDGKPQPFDAQSAIVDQIDKTYVPHVRVLTAGSAVSFPNKDDIRHHVYSFSDAKTFELPLYIGTPANPVQFDSAGVVNLGCNIHDFMHAYILVLETPHYAKSIAGTLSIQSFPPGEVELAEKANHGIPHCCYLLFG